MVLKVEDYFDESFYTGFISTLINDHIGRSKDEGEGGRMWMVDTLTMGAFPS